MWYVCDVLYAVLYVRVSCFVVRGCAVSRRYIDVRYCDMFSVVNVYLDHLKFCVVCINSRRYVCCSECNVVVVIDLPLLRVAVEGSDNPVSLEKPCQASLPPDQQRRHSLGRHPEVQYVA